MTTTRPRSEHLEPYETDRLARLTGFRNLDTVGDPETFERLAELAWQKLDGITRQGAPLRYQVACCQYAREAEYRQANPDYAIARYLA